MRIILTLLITMMLPLTGINGQSQTKESKNKTEVEVINLTKAEFLKQVADYEKNPDTWKYLGDRPAIVDFFATWCPPCKVLSPRLKKLAQEYKGKIYIYKVDVDKEKELAQAFNIRSMPTLLFIPMKGSPQTTNGALSMETLREQVKDVLLVK